MKIPDGWKLVPVEPTPEMIDAGNGKGCCVICMFGAMLASAPTPPASSAGEVITEAMMDAPRPLFLGVIGGGLSKDFTLADHMQAGGWSTAGLDADDLALRRPPTKRHAASMVYRMMRAALASDAGREGV